MPPRYSKKSARFQRPTVWQGPVGRAGLEVDFDDAWELWCAAMDGHLPTIERLIDKEPRIVNAAYRCHCPLDMAIYGGHYTAVRTLINAGTELCYKYGRYSWQRMTRIAMARRFDAIADFLVHTVRERFHYHPDIRLILEAFRDEDIDRLKRLLDESSARVHVADTNGNTALHYAVQLPHPALIDLLVDYGADVNRENGGCLQPHRIQHFDHAGSATDLPWVEGHHESRQRLIELGADDDDLVGDILRTDIDRARSRLKANPQLVHDVRGQQTSPLAHAVRTGDLTMVQLLLDFGANPKMPEFAAPAGLALYEAVSRNHYDIAKLLLEHDANSMSYSEGCGDCFAAAHAEIEKGPERQRMLALLNVAAAGRTRVLLGEQLDIEELISPADGAVEASGAGASPLSEERVYVGPFKSPNEITFRRYATDDFNRSFAIRTIRFRNDVWLLPNDELDQQYETFLSRNNSRPRRTRIIGMDGDTMVALAETFERTIQCDGEPLVVGCLACVGVLRSRRGQGIGTSLVAQAFHQVDSGEFSVMLFQTFRRAFYEHAGAQTIENRFSNSRAADPAKNPWWGDHVMIYSKNFTWPGGPIDLNGEAF